MDTGIYQNFSASYVHLLEKDPQGIVSPLNSNRLNLYYQLSRPFYVTDWFTATPVLGGMITSYGQTNDDEGMFTRVLGEVGFDLEATAIGTWNYQNRFWRINGLRHVLRPIVQYRYVPSAQAGNTLIPQIDRPAAFSTYLQPIDLGQKRNVDSLWEENTFRIGLENLFQTRFDQQFGSYNLVSLNIFQEYRLSTRPAFTVNTPSTPDVPGLPPDTTIQGQNSISDIFIELEIEPIYWFNTRFFTRFDPTSPAINEFDTITNLVDSDEWLVVFGTNYVIDVPDTEIINQYSLAVNYRIDYRNILYGLWRVDAELGELTEQYYSWQTHLGNSWLVEFQIGYLQGSTRENNLSYRVKFSLMKF